MWGAHRNGRRYVSSWETGGNGMKEGQASRKQLTIQKKQSAWREDEAPRALATPLKL